MKKIISLILIICITLSFNTAFAVEKEIEDVLIENGIKDCDEIPEGITPVVVNSVEELEYILNSINDESNNFSQQMSKVYDLKNSNHFSLFALRSTGNTVQRMYEDYFPEGIGGIKVYSKASIFNSGSFTQFSSVDNITSSLVGFNIGTEFVQNDYIAEVSRDGQRFSYTVYGTLNTYLVINGLFKIVSFDKNVSGSHGL